MPKRKRAGLLWALLALLVAALCAIIYLRLARAESGSLSDAAESEELFPVYSAGAALERAEGDAFSIAGSFTTENADSGLHRFDGADIARDSRLFAAGNSLYIVGSSGIFCLDVETGELAALDGPGLPEGADFFAGTLDDGSLWLALTGDTFEFYIFPPSGEALLEYSRPASGGAAWAAVSPDGAALALGFDNMVQIFDLARGELRELSCSAGALQSVFFGRGGLLYGALSEAGGAVSLDSATGEIKELAGLESAVPISADYAIASGGYDGTLTVYPLSSPASALYFPGEGLDTSNISAASGLLLCTGDIDNGSVRRLYNLSDGSIVQWAYDSGVASACALSGSFGWGAYLSGDSVYIFSVESYVSPGGDALSAYLASLPDTACGALAREVAGAAGVFLHWGEDGAAFPSEDFTAGAADDEASLSTMQAVSRFLLSLPEGLIKELLAGAADEMHIYLCQGVRSVPDLGWSTGGFTDISGGSLYIVINTDDYYWVDGNIAHEFWHAMEYRLRILAQAGVEDYVSGWLELMDDEISALYWSSGYDSVDSQWQQDASYCADGETDAERVWFVRAYSRSDPGEDRATVFEALNWSGEQGLFARFPHLKQKAEYLCSALRACFPSCSATEALPWEQILNE